MSLDSCVTSPFLDPAWREVWINISPLFSKISLAFAGDSLHPQAISALQIWVHVLNWGMWNQELLRRLGLSRFVYNPLYKIILSLILILCGVCKMPFIPRARPPTGIFGYHLAFESSGQHCAKHLVLRRRGLTSGNTCLTVHRLTPKVPRNGECWEDQAFFSDDCAWVLIRAFLRTIKWSIVKIYLVADHTNIKRLPPIFRGGNTWRLRYVGVIKLIGREAFLSGHTCLAELSLSHGAWSAPK